MDYSAAIPGVDLSHHDDAQGDRPMDYNKLVANVKWAILRVGDGGATDRSFVRHVSGISGRIPIGTYLFARPGRDPRRQAEQWGNAVNHMSEGWGAKFPLGHFIDLESSDHLSVTAVTEWISDFLAVSDQIFGTTGIYTGISWWRNSVIRGYDPGDRVWWIARYPFGGQPSDDPALWPQWVQERIRPMREPEAPLEHETDIWQFTSQGSGSTVGTYRPHALDCNLMDRKVFDTLTGVVDSGLPPVLVPVNNPEAELPDTLEFMKRDNEDPRVYLVIGRKYKMWMEDMLALERHAARLGIPAVIVNDTLTVNLAFTIGEEPS